MRYFAQVTVAFSTERSASNASDIWEVMLAVDAEGPGEALLQALSKSRMVLDDSENWRALGYSKKPCLYGVRGIHTDDHLPGSKASCNSDFMILTWIGTFDETQMAKLAAFEHVLLPYCVM